MGALERMNSPADLRALSPHELAPLASEIRQLLVERVSATGGHLGPNLGVVELTIAVHRVFSSPRDPILFDTGHQAYVHKILTGRAGNFGTLRAGGGLSGYPSRAESEHDVTESSHASASLSVADGMAKAFELRGENDRTVVAIIGDGALTGGMAAEALNNFFVAAHRPLVIIVNDNGRSYSPTIGGLAARIVSRGANQVAGELGFDCIGPVDGHSLPELEDALRRAKDSRRTVLVHVRTLKGHGFALAEGDSAELMHSTSAIDPESGTPLHSAPGTTFTDVFGDELCALAESRSDIVAVTAAMAGPTGLTAFAERFQDRFLDVGIAEQHAVASASGLALGGMHPVVAMYSTFLGRAFDQLLLDVALLGQPVTFTLDRAGITGPDGPSHHGMWDLALAGIVPGLRVAAPRDEPTLRRALREATAHSEGPTLVRYPKGEVPTPASISAVLPGGVEVLRRADRADSTSVVHDPSRMTTEEAIPDPAVLIVGIGIMAGQALDCAHALEEQGIDAVAATALWVLPVPEALVELAGRASLVAVIEDGAEHGGVGSSIEAAMSSRGVDTPLRRFALPQEFINHASRAEILRAAGLDGAAIADRIAVERSRR
ncbi:1-deoxy-D-xylulose-5-phosphate synthase [Dietzia timorensis]|uniref:1-deoxy-D-xylulose-5-phosphate synthase n=1 Tax=Dietzia timorensis TaxID=499555 RepID=A0A173LKZ0_9ACTN|nr:1-deoxy-D-xylulose-5-phosphate synthase [Dietzia timorensis]ANI92553.1 1-deoxy-D-xylulose-5-phosphate synthase [Dietzia timorensis]